MIAGCKTQFCIDTTCRRATTLGYDVILVGDAHTTWDTDILPAKTIIAYHNDILDDFGNDDHVVLTKPTVEITFL